MTRWSFSFVFICPFEMGVVDFLILISYAIFRFKSDLRSEIFPQTHRHTTEMVIILVDMHKTYRNSFSTLLLKSWAILILKSLEVRAGNRFKWNNKFGNIIELSLHFSTKLKYTHMHNDKTNIQISNISSLFYTKNYWCQFIHFKILLLKNTKYTVLFVFKMTFEHRIHAMHPITINYNFEHV